MSEVPDGVVCQDVCAAALRLPVFNAARVRIASRMSTARGISRMVASGTIQNLLRLASGTAELASIKVKEPSHCQPITHHRAKQDNRAARPIFHMASEFFKRKNTAGSSNT